MLRNFVHLLAHFTLIIILRICDEKRSTFVCAFTFLLIHNFFVKNFTRASHTARRKLDWKSYDCLFKFKMWKFKQLAVVLIMNFNLFNIFNAFAICCWLLTHVESREENKISGSLNEWIFNSHRRKSSRRANLKCI